MPQRTTDPLRRAAILVSSLDARSADALLDQMPPEQAARVRLAVLDLPEIDSAEQQAIISEFLRGPARPTAEGVELDPSLARRIAERDEPETAADRREAEARPVGPFSALFGEPATALARLLRREHPQTAAIVLAHLPPDRSADVLSLLPADVQAEVLRRVAHLEEPSPEVVRELEQSLCGLLSAEQHARERRSAGIAAAGAILEAARHGMRRELLATLAARDADLAARLDPAAEAAAGSPAGGSRFSFAWPRFLSADRRPAATPQAVPERERSAPDEEPDEDDTWIEESTAALPALSFDEFGRLSDRALARVLSAADSRLAQLAFTGARPELVSRLLKQLPPKEAKDLRRRLDLAGPLRLREVELARRQLELLVGRLAARGEIELPAARRFAAAA